MNVDHIFKDRPRTGKLMTAIITPITMYRWECPKCGLTTTLKHNKYDTPVPCMKCGTELIGVND